MDTPKISGLLHNCSLYCALPTLLDGITLIAAMEKAGQLKKIEKNPVIQSYVLLKALFAKYYGMTPEMFSFQIFHSFIENYTFPAQEIIFSPVLRSFVKEKAQEYNASLYEVQEDGHYQQLAWSEANELFYTHFGIQYVAHKFVKAVDTQNPENNYDTFDPKLGKIENYPFGEQPCIHLYHNNNHYELQPHETANQNNKEYFEMIDKLPEYLKNVHDNIIFPESSESTQRSFKILQEAIYLKITHHISKKEDTSTISNLFFEDNSFDLFHETGAENQDFFHEAETQSMDFFREMETENEYSFHENESDEEIKEIEEKKKSELESIMISREENEKFINKETEHSRDSIQQIQADDQIIIDLKALCKQYKIHLENKKHEKYNEKIEALNAINSCLYSADSLTDKIKNFKGSLDNHKAVLEPHKDPIAIIILSAIRDLLTLGFYSKITKGTFFVFWKSHGQAFVQNAEQDCQDYASQHDIKFE